MIMNKKNIFQLTALAMLLVLAGCEKKIDEAFANPNASVRVPVETLLPGIIGNFVGSSAAAGSAYGTANDGLYIGRYVQFWATNSAGNQYDQMGGATGASDVLGSVWAMHYFGMGENLNKMVKWGIEEEKWDYAGVGYAIRAWSWLQLTNMYGEVILKEAFRPDQLVFKYDNQNEVYDSVRAIAHRAIAYLEKTGGQSGQANLAKGDAYFYNGDVSKWKKFAYSVLARSFSHLSNKTSYNADSVIKYAQLGINSNAENATAKFANTGITGTSNFYGPYRNNVGTLRQTDYIANLVNGLNSRFSGATDPRAWYLLRENTNKTIRGIKPNKGSSGLAANDQPQGFWGQTFGTATAPVSDAGARYIFKNGAPFPIITASEIKFMLAEAYLRKGDAAAARTAYTDGISLNIDMLTTDYNNGIQTDKIITPAVKASFLANPIVVPSAANLTLSHIMLQKYIALYGFGMMETWVDMRRFHYVDVDAKAGGQVYADLVLPTGTDLYINNSGKYTYRARPRYNSEYLYNVAELTRLGATALDYNTKEQWFSQK
jgi:Starch-binding associating with outer membrane